MSGSKRGDLPLMISQKALESYGYIYIVSIATDHRLYTVFAGYANACALHAHMVNTAKPLVGTVCIVNSSF
jgi:hypothetical protein